MKKVLITIAFICALATAAIASIQISIDGANQGQYRKVNLSSGLGVDVDGTIYFQSHSADPCANLTAGSIFIKEATGAPCFCNSLGVDLSLYDGTTACY